MINQPEHPRDCKKIELRLPVSGDTVKVAKYQFLTEDLDKIADLAAVTNGRPGRGRGLAAEASLVTFRPDGSFITMEEILKWPLNDTMAVHTKREEEGFFELAKPNPAAEEPSS